MLKVTQIPNFINLVIMISQTYCLEAMARRTLFFLLVRDHVIDYLLPSYLITLHLRQYSKTTGQKIQRLAKLGKILGLNGNQILQSTVNENLE